MAKNYGVKDFFGDILAGMAGITPLYKARAAGMPEAAGTSPEVFQALMGKRMTPLEQRYKEAQIRGLEEEIPISRQYKEAQIKAMKALGSMRERSMGERISGMPTLSNVSGIFSDVSAEIENRPDVMTGRMKGTLSEEQIDELKNTTFFQRLNTLVPTYKAVRGGQVPSGTPSGKKLSADEVKALEWADANPNDPRAQAIKRKYGR